MEKVTHERVDHKDESDPLWAPAQTMRDIAHVLIEIRDAIEGKERTTIKPPWNNPSRIMTARLVSTAPVRTS